MVWKWSYLDWDAFLSAAQSLPGAVGNRLRRWPPRNRSNGWIVERGRVASDSLGNLFRRIVRRALGTERLGETRIRRYALDWRHHCRSASGCRFKPDRSSYAGGQDLTTRACLSTCNGNVRLRHGSEHGGLGVHES